MGRVEVGLSLDILYLLVDHLVSILLRNVLFLGCSLKILMLVSLSDRLASIGWLSEAESELVFADS